jgi:hypothetical protein
MIRNVSLPLLAALTLTACSGEREIASGTVDDGKGGTASYSVSESGEGVNATVKTEDGEVNFSSGDGGKIALPLGIKLYPGAQVQSSAIGNANGQSSAMVVLSSEDSQDKVIDYYRQQLAGAGVKIEAEVTTGDMKMIGGKSGDGTGFNINTVPGEDGKVTVTIIAGK